MTGRDNSIQVCLMKLFSAMNEITYDTYSAGYLVPKMLFTHGCPLMMWPSYKCIENREPINS